MRRAGQGKRVAWAAAFLVFVGFPTMALRTAPNRKTGGQSDPSAAKKVAIYLSDFELASAPAPRPNPKTGGTAPAQKPTGAIYAETDAPSVQARRVVDAFATTLADAFQKDGYRAARQTGDLPSAGVLLEGVFAEADRRNRIRRAILGAGSPGPTFILYVGVFNLSRQDQPLYQAAPVQSADSHYGPVISLNAYVPMVKFEVPKEPTEEDVRKICEQIVSQLTSLLVRNPEAISQ